MTKNELWSKKGLIWDFAISNLQVKYRNSFLGFVWTFLEPLLLLTVLYVVFTNIFETSIEFFPLYLLLGLILWNMFVNGTRYSLDSIVGKGPLLTQVPIPLAIMPISSALTSLIMISLEMIVFALFLIAFQFLPPITIVILPLIIVINFILTLGIAFPLSVLNVKYRDIQFIWTVVLQAGFFLNPIFYKIEILPQTLQDILKFNPMTQILIIARDVSLYGNLPKIEDVVILLSTTLGIFMIGYLIFKIASTKTIEEI